ncbi:hypothetical protein ARMSODRAFT_561719 [Armillaria solidipes]|uniref:Uncharacterized protein n=1 Tax=Armillaria solidipes TaxID=1076256 RepID=A0A2H3AVN5_9AGAR|nr:hypothetical protein ARMSODRAFT_561719 [Armillaria solidipes]
MSGDLNIGTCIQSAKLAAIVGEMAPIPYATGVAGCIVTILEVIESIGKTIRIIKETVEAYGDTSTTHFRAVCVELQIYLENLNAELHTTRRKLKSKGMITRFLTTKKVSRVIDGYKQQVNNINADFLDLATTASRFAMSEMQDALFTAITDERCRLEEEVHAVEVRYEKLRDLKGYYKGQAGVVLIKHVYILFVDSRTHERN